MKMIYLNQARFKEVQKNVDTVIIPIGTIEAHGQHLPLGTDVLIPEGLVEKIEEKIGDKILIAPSVNYGHVWTLGAYPGSVDIPTKVLIRYIEEIGKSLIDDGFKNIFLLNGHGGNIPAVTTVGEILADYGGQAVVFNWWIDFNDEILKVCEGQGHAGEDESSAVLAVAEEHCDMDLAEVNNDRLIARIYRQDIGKVSYKHALSGDATKASREKGEEILERVSKRMVEIIERIWKDDILK